MKVTALIPDNLVHEVKQYAGGNTLTESLIVALEEWLSLKKIKTLNAEIESNPLSFSDNFSAGSIRNVNRKR
jgi:hypothetical protein